MWTFILIALAGLLPIALVGYAVYAVVTRGFEFKQLLTDGVETNGTVVRKRIIQSSSSRGTKSRQLRYEYHDSLGRAHQHASLVTDSVFDAHEEGRPIEVIYSASRPEVSAPKYLVEQARPAWERRQKKQTGQGGAP